MNKYASVLLLTIGVLNVVTSQGDYSTNDETELMSRDHNLEEDARLRLDEDDHGKDEHRKSRFYQYYRIKKIRGKPYLKDGTKILQFLNQQKESETEKSDSDLYEQNVSFVQHYLDNERQILQKDLKDYQYQDGEYKYVYMQDKLQNDGVHILSEKEKDDFQNIHNFRFYTVSKLQSKPNGTDLRKHENNYQNMARNNNEKDLNTQKIYIRRNKNHQYFKKIQNIPMFDNDTPPKSKDQNKDAFRSMNEDVNKQYTNSQNNKYDHNLMLLRNKHYDSPKTHEHDSYDLQNKFGIRYTSNKYQNKEERRKMQSSTDSRYAEIYPEHKNFTKHMKHVHYLDDIKEIQKYILDKKGDKKNYQHYGIAKNTLYHKDRNNRNNSRNFENNSSYHHYHDETLPYDDIRQHMSEIIDNGGNKNFEVTYNIHDKKERQRKRWYHSIRDQNEQPSHYAKGYKSQVPHRLIENTEVDGRGDSEKSDNYYDDDDGNAKIIYDDGARGNDQQTKSSRIRPRTNEDHDLGVKSISQYREDNENKRRTYSTFIKKHGKEQPSDLGQSFTSGLTASQIKHEYSRDE